MKTLQWFMTLCEYLGGSRYTFPQAPAGPGGNKVSDRNQSIPWWLGLWWGLLLGGILLFCGQTSKFIYVDF